MIAGKRIDTCTKEEMCDSCVAREEILPSGIPLGDSLEGFCATPHVFEKDRYKISVIRGISGILSGFSLVQHCQNILIRLIFK